MKSKVVSLSLLLLLCLAIPSLAGGFDCAAPKYGAPLTEMNDNDYFVKFMESDGVAYYNYTGPCKMEIHKRMAPLVVYGFVDGKLYTRIMRTWHDDLSAVQEYTSRTFGEAKVTKRGNWKTLSWDVAGQDMKLKIKINEKTGETKSAAYYEPLRQGVTNPKVAKDPEKVLD